MRSAEVSFDLIVGKAYDAVFAPEGFTSLIGAMIDCFQLKAAIMVTVNVENGQSKGLWMDGISPQYVESYSLRYGAQDMLARLIERSPIAHFYSSNLDLEPDLFEASPFFKEWVIPQGVSAASGAILLQEVPWVTQLILQRSPTHPVFSRDELTYFNRLLPHLRRAVQMRQRFIELRIGQDFLLSGFDTLSMPMVLIDEFGRFAHCNRSAERYVNADGDLFIESSTLTVHSPVIQKRLQFEVTKAIVASRGALDRPPSVVSVARVDKRPLMVLVTPMKAARNSQVTGGALLFIFDPERAQTGDTSLVQRLFGLTEAEAELADGLCSGFSLAEIAAARHRSFHTVRAQLKSVFLKTGTQRQSELVSVLLGSPAYFLAESARA